MSHFIALMVVVSILQAPLVAWDRWGARSDAFDRLVLRVETWMLRVETALDVLEIILVVLVVIAVVVTLLLGGHPSHDATALLRGDE